MEARKNRVKPWKSKTLKVKDKPSYVGKLVSEKTTIMFQVHMGGWFILNTILEIHYQKSLPSNQWVQCKPKKYVTNHKYGNHYEVR